MVVSSTVPGCRCSLPISKCRRLGPSSYESSLLSKADMISHVTTLVVQCSRCILYAWVLGKPVMCHTYSICTCEWFYVHTCVTYHTAQCCSSCTLSIWVVRFDSQFEIKTIGDLCPLCKNTTLQRNGKWAMWQRSTIQRNCGTHKIQNKRLDQWNRIKWQNSQLEEDVSHRIRCWRWARDVWRQGVLQVARVLPLAPAKDQPSERRAIWIEGNGAPDGAEAKEGRRKEGSWAQELSKESRRKGCFPTFQWLGFLSGTCECTNIHCFIQVGVFREQQDAHGIPCKRTARPRESARKDSRANFGL